ncbi:MAG: GGDEF domain-containing protein [Fibrobacteria bacterium]|nr:GGDEF domain-containing protein [Fibrobacteria bacterium]
MGIRNFINQLLESDDDPFHPPPSSVGAPSDVGESSVGEPPDPGLVRALAETLRAVGEGSFDMDDADGDEVRARFEEMARRVESRDPSTLRTLAENVSTHRRRERHWVTKTMRDMADTVVGLAHRLGRNVVLDRASDGKVDGQLHRLKAAAASENPSHLRKEVLSAVEQIASAVREREDRQRSEMAAIARQLESLKAELAHTRKEMAIDGLTRLYNRASLDEHLRNIHAIAVLSGRSACLLMIDLDHFKNVNDTHGHQAGDAVLKSVADLLAKSFPRRGDFVARYGGEEFVVVLSEDDVSTGTMLATRLLERCRQLVVAWEGVEIQVRLSVGVAGFEGDGEVGDWLARADEAMYQAKEEGRDRVVAG